MSIWKKPIDNLKSTQKLQQKTIVSHLGIEVTEIGDDFLTAKMPVDHRTHQPMGILHGGASVVLAETVGSIASNYAIDMEHYAVGLEINANHLRPVSEGYVYGTARPIHLGKTTHVWAIEIVNDERKQTCVSRMYRHYFLYAII